MSIIPTEQTQKVAIIPETTKPVDLINPEAKKTLSKQTELAFGDPDAIQVEGNSLESMRAQAASKDFEEKKQERVSSLSALIADPETDSEVIAKSMQELSNMKMNKAALEKRAVEKTASPVDNYYADLVQRNESSDELTRYIDRKATAQMINNWLAAKRTKEEAENIFEESWDFVKEVFSLELIGKWSDGNYIENFRSKVNAISKLPIEDRADALLEIEEELEDLQILGHNPQTAIDIMKAVTENTEDDDELQLLSDIFEGTFVLGGAAIAAGKGVTKTAKVIRSVQDTNRALKEAALKGGKDEDLVLDLNKSEEDSVFFTTPEQKVDAQMIMKIQEEDFRSLSAEHQKQLLSNVSKLSHLQKHTIAPEFTSEILKRNLEEMSSGLPLESVVKYNVDYEQGLFNLQYGTLTGKPFKTEQAAQKFAQDNNIPIESLVKIDGGFTIRSKISDPAQLKLDADKIVTRASAINLVDNIVAPMFKQVGNQASDAAQGILAEGRDIFKKGIMSNLTKQKHFDGWEKVVNSGIDWDNGVDALKGKWLDSSEFKAEWNRLNPSVEYDDKFFAAYQNYKLLNDFSWMQSNNAKVAQKRSQGLKGFVVESEDGFKVDVEGDFAKIEDITDISGNNKHIMVYDGITKQGTNEFYTANPGDLSPQMLEELSGTHNLVKLDKESVAVMTDNGMPFSRPSEYVFLPKSINAGDVSQFQIPYRAGGRRIQDLTHAVKAARYGKYTDGTRYRMTDKALFSAGSIKQAKEFSKKLDEAFKIAQDMKKGRIGQYEADDAFYALGVHSKLAVDDLDGFIKWGVSKKLIDDTLDEIPVIQGVRDGERVAIDKGIDIIEDFNDDVLDFSDGLKLTKHRTNEELPSLSGGNTRLLDPVSALSRNLDQSARMSGFGPLKERTLSAFQQHYGRYLESYNPKEPLSLLDSAIKDTVKDSDLIQQIKNQQAYLKELLNHKTASEQWWQDKAENIVDFMFDGIPGLEKNFNKLGAMYKGARGIEKQGRGVRRNVREALAKNPLFRAKSAMFHSKLGLFNVASFIQQFSHTVVVAAISGKTGMVAGTRGLVARTLTRLDPEALKAYSEKAWKTLGYESAEDMVNYVTLFKQLGFHQVDQSAIIMSGMQGSQLSTSKVDRVLDAGKVFFNEGEIASRITAYGSAYLKWQRKVGDINPKNLPVTHPDAIKWISSETHRLMLGMSRSDLQLGLRGGMSVPTQFLSYPLRAIAAMMPGSGKAFTKQEKIRMAAAYMAMAGTAGIPIAGSVAEWVMDKYPNLTGSSAEVDKFITNGLLDGMLYAMFDLDVNLSSRIGPGQLLPELWKKITEGNPWEILAGPGPATGWKAFDAMMEAWSLHYTAGTLDMATFTSATWQGISKQVSSWNNIHKAIMAIEEGKLFMGNRKALADMSSAEAVLMVLGLPPQAYEDMSKQFSSLSKSRKFKKQAVDNLFALHAKYIDAYESENFDEAQKIKETIHAYTVGLDNLGVSLEVQQQLMREQRSQDLMTRLMNKSLELQNRGEDLKMGTVLKRRQEEQ